MGYLSNDILGEVLDIVREFDETIVMYALPHGGAFYLKKLNYTYLLTNEQMNEDGVDAKSLANLILRCFKLHLIFSEGILL